MLIDCAIAESPSHTSFRPIPAIYQKTGVTEGGLLPYFGGAGTGGGQGAEFFYKRAGYQLFVVISTKADSAEENFTIYSELMEEIQAGFGRTLSHLPAVFGVSRQTLYNWMNGELPKEQHRDKLVQLAEAAKVFLRSGFKPTAANLSQTVSKGKSFIDLLGEGAKGSETAEKLILIAQRGIAERNKLHALLGDREKPRLEIQDMGRQSFPDEA